MVLRFLDDSLDMVARDARHTLRARVGIAALSLTLVGLNLGFPVAIAWFACVVASEAWTWQATKPMLDAGVASPRQRLNYAGSILAITGVWLAVAVLYWATGEPALRLVAMVVLCSQLIHAQSFSFRSKLALILNGGPPAATLIALPLLFGTTHGVQAITIGVSLGLTILYVTASAAANMKTTAELERAQAAAVAANRAKSTFLAMMGHELRTPMNGVLGMAHALKLTSLDERQANQVDMLIRSGDGLMAILNDLLDVSKIEAGKFDLELTTIDLRDVGQRVHDLWTEVAERQGRRPGLRHRSGHPALGDGDPTRIRQIMLNLVSNALKFTEQGEVRLSLKPAEGGVMIAVSDTGLGISEGQQAKLFQAFSQAEASTARRFGGTGLGLSICKHLSEMMDGQIGVESREGVGSTFRVFLPLPEAAAPQNATPDLGGGWIQDRRLLVAEDNAINQAVARAILEAAGAHVTIVGDGAEALDVLRAGTFDAVLMDVHMPHMDGLEALRRIRAGETGRADIPVIALTADAVPGEDGLLIAKGFDQVQGKPIKPALLLAAVAACCAEADDDEDDRAVA